MSQATVAIPIPSGPTVKVVASVVTAPIFADPVAHPPSVRHSASSSGPAAR